jgi:hypothetical protein
MADTNASTNSGEGIRDRISALVTDEHRLRTHANPTEDDRAALASIENELDQCWDLLRQRRALSESGMDPEEAKARPTAEVEGYLQ